MTDWDYPKECLSQVGKSILDQECRHIWLDVYDEYNQQLNYQICANCEEIRLR